MRLYDTRVAYIYYTANERAVASLVVLLAVRRLPYGLPCDSPLGIVSILGVL